MTRHTFLPTAAVALSPMFGVATGGGSNPRQPGSRAATRPPRASRAAQVEAAPPLHRLIDDLLRRSAALRRGWTRLLGHPQLVLRVQAAPGHPDRTADVTVEAHARPTGDVFATLYVSEGQGLACTLAVKVHQLGAWLDATQAAAPRGPGHDHA